MDIYRWIDRYRYSFNCTDALSLSLSTVNRSDELRGRPAGSDIPRGTGAAAGRGATPAGDDARVSADPRAERPPVRSLPGQVRPAGPQGRQLRLPRVLLLLQGESRA